jgi:hypothetical protein
MSLITEGLADLVIAARIGYTRKFSWSDYRKHKAVSLIISAVLMGFASAKYVDEGEEVLGQILKLEPKC